MKTKGNKNIDRREFLKRLGAGAAVSGSAMLVGCDSGKNPVNGESTTAQGPIPKDKMTNRINPKTGDKVSILGYGCMRWPTVTGESAREAAHQRGDEVSLRHCRDYSAISHDSLQRLQVLYALSLWSRHSRGYLSTTTSV